MEATEQFKKALNKIVTILCFSATYISIVLLTQAIVNNLAMHGIIATAFFITALLILLFF
jgi:hypothetical protein